MQSKTALRKIFRHRLASLTPVAREEAAQVVAMLFSQQAFFKTSRHIACYLSLPSEFNVSPLIEMIWQAKKNCYVPALAAEGKLHFVRYDDGMALHANRYGILEPVQSSEIFPASELDVVVVPLLAFDKAGHRLGTGGGYYDKTFAFLQADSTAPHRKPQLIAAACAVQEAKTLPADTWDILLQAAITEKGVFIFGK